MGGLVTVAVGIGLMLFFGWVVDRDARGVMFIGAIPPLIGLALLAYTYFLAPKE